MVIAASAMNFGGVILFSKGFTNEAINEADLRIETMRAAAARAAPRDANGPP